jgi:hypothetical protein
MRVHFKLSLFVPSLLMVAGLAATAEARRPARSHDVGSATSRAREVILTDLRIAGFNTAQSAQLLSQTRAFVASRLALTDFDAGFDAQLAPLARGLSYQELANFRSSVRDWVQAASSTRDARRGDVRLIGDEIMPISSAARAPAPPAAPSSASSTTSVGFSVGDPCMTNTDVGEGLFCAEISCDECSTLVPIPRLPPSPPCFPALSCPGIVVVHGQAVDFAGNPQAFCEGFPGFLCETGFTCWDDPSDSAHLEDCGGADLGGQCIIEVPALIEACD